MTDRIPLDDMTDDALDALYAERDSWETTAYRHASLWRTEQGEVQRHVTANLEAAERAQQEIDRLRAVIRRIDQMVTAWDERLPEVIRTAVAVEAIRTALEPAQRPLAATGSGTGVGSPPSAKAP